MAVVEDYPASVLFAVVDGRLGLHFLAFAHRNDMGLVDLQSVSQCFYTGGGVCALRKKEQHGSLLVSLPLGVFDHDLDGVNVDAGAFAEHSFDQLLRAKVAAVLPEAADEHAQLECT